MFQRTLHATVIAALTLIAPVALVATAHAQPCIGSQTWQELPLAGIVTQGLGKTVDISDDGRIVVATSPDLGVIWTRSAAGTWSTQTFSYPGRSITLATLSRDGSTLMVLTNIETTDADIWTWERQPDGSFTQQPSRLDVTSVAAWSSATSASTPRSWGNAPVQISADGRTVAAIHGPVGPPNSTVQPNAVRIFTRAGAGSPWTLQTELPATDTTSPVNTTNAALPNGVGLSADGQTAFLLRLFSNPTRVMLDAFTRSSNGSWVGPQALPQPAEGPPYYYHARISSDGATIVSYAFPSAGVPLTLRTFNRTGPAGAPTWSVSGPVATTVTSYANTQGIAFTGGMEMAFAGAGFSNPLLPSGLSVSVQQLLRSPEGGWMQAATEFPGLDATDFSISEPAGGVKVSSGGEFIVMGLPRSAENAANQPVLPAGQTGRVFVLDTRGVGPTTQPQDRNVPVGGSALLTFNAVVGPGNAPIYRWFRNGVQLTDGPSATGTVYAGANSGNLSISNAQPGDHRAVYTCSITNSCNGLTSRPAVLQVGSGCLADLGQTGGIPGADGFLNSDDFIVFIDYFFSAAGCL